MGGSGGGGSVEVIDHQRIAHSLLLLGHTGHSGVTSRFAWDGAEPVDEDSVEAYNAEGNFDDNPSALRFIIDSGITLSGGNPYEGVSGYDPSSDLSEVEAALGNLKTAIDAIDHDVDYNADVETARAKADTVVEQLDVNGIVSQILTSALASATAAITSALANSYTAVKLVTDDASTRATSMGSAASSNILGNAIAEARSIYGEAITEVAATASTFDPAVDAIMQLAFTIVSAGADDVIQEAFANAAAFSSSGAINDAVDAYEAETLPEYLAATNRLAAGAADVNAVQTTTFILGMAIQGSERSKQIGRKRSELQLEAFRSVFASFTQFNITVLGQYLSTHAQERASNINLVQSLTAILQVASGTELETLRTFFAGDLDMTRAASANWTGMYNGDENNYLNAVIRARLQEKVERANMIQLGSSQLLNRSGQALSDEAGYAALLSDVKKASIVALTDSYQRDLGLDVQEANWDLDLFQKAGNIISAVSGSVVQQPDRPSGGQIALSATLTTASIAAAFFAPNPATIANATAQSAKLYGGLDTATRND